MKPNVQEFMQQLDIITQSCRLRNSFVKMWKRCGIEHAMKYCPLNKLQREIIEELIIKLEIK